MRKVENQNKEFKQVWNDNCFKTICAFANTGGGKLFLGIDDEGKPVGIKDAARYLDDIPNKTKDILGITPDVKVKKKDGKNIIEVSVAPSSAPISYHGRFYTRSGSSSIEIKGNELVELLMKKSGRSWDGFIEDRATLKDIDQVAINRFRKLAAKKIPLIAEEKSTQAILQKLNLLEKGKLRRAALLLFGKDPKKFYITAYIKIGKFTSATNLVSTDDVEGNLFDQVEKAMEMLRIKYLLSSITYEGIYRQDNMEYPEDALREAIINAVIHRNYIGAHTQLRIDTDSLNLWNEGGLPPEISVSDLKKWHLSKPRNEFIADVFFKAGMIEAWGRGTIQIIDECRKAGLPAPEFREEFGGISVHFKKVDKAQEEAQFGVESEAQVEAQEAQVEAQEAQVGLIKWQVDILQSCFVDEKTGREILETAGYRSRTGNFKKGLQKLIDHQLLELTIPDKPNSRLQKYRLTEKGQSFLARMQGDKKK